MDNIHLLICNIMCVQQKVNQFHTTLSEKKVQSLHWITEFVRFFTKSYHLDDTRHKSLWIHFVPFSVWAFPTLLPSTFMSSPCPLTTVLSHLCRAASRWRSPRLQRRPRWAWARAGQSEPSVGMKGSAGPLSRLAPGGCAGSWRPRWASAASGPGAPPGLATAQRAPSLASSPWGSRLKQ